LARTVNATTHAVRRDAFLDATERLIRTKGWEQVSIQAILDELDVSKGAFYHYFDSKEALLEAVVGRIADGVMSTLAPIASDPDLQAAEKLQGVFLAAGQWKAERKDLMLGLLRAWYSDHNAVVREQLRRASTTRLAPLLAGIVRQGKAEGAFSVTWPDHAAGVLVALLVGSSETTSQLFMARLTDAIPLEEVERAMAAYSEAIERILGLSAGSFEYVDAPSLRCWFT
jgi:AcrR family transcriptional regulator